jgi:hypothetical protein
MTERDSTTTPLWPPTITCHAYPLNGCAHPQFCRAGCAGRPIRDGDWDAVKRDIETAIWQRETNDE